MSRQRTERTYQPRARAHREQLDVSKVALRPLVEKYELRVDRPKLTLQSDAQPPISQSDLLSYLAFGRSSSSLLQNEGSSASSGNARIHM